MVPPLVAVPHRSPENHTSFPAVGGQRPITSKSCYVSEVWATGSALRKHKAIITSDTWPRAQGKQLAGCA